MNPQVKAAAEQRLAEDAAIASFSWYFLVMWLLWVCTPPPKPGVRCFVFSEEVDEDQTSIQEPSIQTS